MAGELTRFQPGKSGNPAGRPAAKPITDRLKNVLEKTGKDGRSAADRVVEQWLDMIAAGDASALRELLARLEGRVIDNVHHDGGLTIKVVYAGGRDRAAGSASESTVDPRLMQTVQCGGVWPEVRQDDSGIAPAD